MSYIDDLPSAAKLKCVMFADDSNLLICGNNLEELVNNCVGLFKGGLGEKLVNNLKKLLQLTILRS